MPWAGTSYTRSRMSAPWGPVAETERSTAPTSGGSALRGAHAAVGDGRRPLRNCPGRRVRDAATPRRGGDLRVRTLPIRYRGLAGGDGEVASLRHREIVAGLCGRPAALTDGCGKRPPRFDRAVRARRGSLRLRPDHAERPQRAEPTAEGPRPSPMRASRGTAPLDAACPCEACGCFSRAYLRHLFLARELLGYRLLTLHNLTFFLGLMAAMRRAVADGAFVPFRSRFLDRYGVESVGGSDSISTKAEA